MKKFLTLMLVLASLVADAQLKKQKPKTVPPPAAATQDSVVLRGRYQQDTIKVMAVLLVEDGTLLWKKAYVLQPYFLTAGGEKIPSGREVLVDEQFQAIRPQDVLDVKTRSW